MGIDHIYRIHDGNIYMINTIEKKIILVINSPFLNFTDAFYFIVKFMYLTSAHTFFNALKHSLNSLCDEFVFHF